MKTYISRNNNKYYLDQVKNVKGVTNADGNPFTEQRDLDSWLIQRSGANKLIHMKFEHFRQALEHIENSESPIRDTFTELIKLVEVPEEVENNRPEIDRLREEFNKHQEELSVYLDDYLK